MSGVSLTQYDIDVTIDINMINSGRAICSHSQLLLDTGFLRNLSSPEHSHLRWFPDWVHVKDHNHDIRYYMQVPADEQLVTQGKVPEPWQQTKFLVSVVYMACIVVAGISSLKV